ncbi:hypothetical protein D3C72_2593820 [compost metagenome]
MKVWQVAIEEELLLLIHREHELVQPTMAGQELADVETVRPMGATVLHSSRHDEQRQVCVKDR